MLTTIAKYTIPIEAHILRGRLEAEGIPSYVVHEYHIGVNWFLANALGGIKVQIHKKYVSSALKLIDDIDKGKYQLILEEQQGPFDEISCPSCKSKLIKECRLSEKVSLILFWMFTLTLPFTKNKRKCNDCGNKWIAKEEYYYSVLDKSFMLIFLLGFYFIVIQSLYFVCEIYYLNSICK